MKVSDLIRQLQELQERHGDVPVFAFGCLDETPSEVSEVDFRSTFGQPRIHIDP